MRPFWESAFFRSIQHFINSTIQFPLGLNTCYASPFLHRPLPSWELPNAGSAREPRWWLGGYADDLFNTLFRLEAGRMKTHGYEWGTTGRSSFTQDYGVLETITKVEPAGNACSKAKATSTIRRKPGASPLLFGEFLMQLCAFVFLEDISAELPPYEETCLGVAMDPTMFGPATDTGKARGRTACGTLDCRHPDKTGPLGNCTLDGSTIAVVGESFSRLPQPEEPLLVRCPCRSSVLLEVPPPQQGILDGLLKVPRNRRVRQVVKCPATHRYKVFRPVARP